MKKALILLLLGGGGGAAGYHYGKPQIMPHLEPFIGDGHAEVEGVVMEKREEDERLVLVLRSGNETFLASFRERMSDVSTLVHEGDTVVLESTGEVFSEDATILRVRRGGSESGGSESGGSDSDGSPSDGSESAEAEVEAGGENAAEAESSDAAAGGSEEADEAMGEA